MITSDGSGMHAASIAIRIRMPGEPVAEMTEMMMPASQARICSIMAIAHARRGRALPPRMHVGARAPLNLLALWRADAARADPRHPVPRCDAPQFRGVRRTPDARAGGARWGRSEIGRAHV